MSHGDTPTLTIMRHADVIVKRKGMFICMLNKTFITILNTINRSYTNIS